MQGMNHGDIISTPRKVTKTQHKQQKRSSKPLLDEGQGKKEWFSQNGRPKRSARKTKQVTGGAPSARVRKSGWPKSTSNKQSKFRCDENRNERQRYLEKLQVQRPVADSLVAWPRGSAPKGKSTRKELRPVSD